MDKNLQLLRTLLPHGYDVVAQDFRTGDYLVARDEYVMKTATQATQIGAPVQYSHATRIKTEWVEDRDTDRINSRLLQPLVSDESVCDRLASIRKDLISKGFAREAAETLAPLIARIK